MYRQIREPGREQGWLEVRERVELLPAADDSPRGRMGEALGDLEEALSSPRETAERIGMLGAPSFPEMGACKNNKRM